MKKDFPPFVVKGGVVKDKPPFELAEGIWSDSVNFRHRDGVSEKFEGTGTSITTSFSPYWLELLKTASEFYVVWSSLTKSYANASATSSSATEITRYTDGVEIASITQAGTTCTVNTVTAHGRSTGHAIDVFGAVPTAFNVTNKSITVVDADTFTYVADSAPGSDATETGQYAYRVTSDFTSVGSATGQKMTGGVLGGVVLYNHPIDGLYYWAGDTTVRMRKVKNAYVARVSRVWNNSIVQLQPTIGGTRQRWDVVISDTITEAGELPSEFTDAEDNDADRITLSETLGEVIDCEPLGDALIVYKNDGSAYAIRYVGADELKYSVQRLRGVPGIAGIGCIASIPEGHVIITPDLDVMLHSGANAVSISDGQVKNYIRRAQLGSASYGPQYSHVFYYPAKSEVWVCIADLAWVARHVYVWGRSDRQWSYFYEVNNPGAGAYLAPTYAVRGLWPMDTAQTDIREVAVFGNATNVARIGFLTGEGTGKIYSWDITATLERTGLHWGDTRTMKYLDQLAPQIDGDAAETDTWYTGSSQTADGTVTWTSGATFTLGTSKKVDQRCTQGPFLALKMSTTAYPRIVRTVALYGGTGGKR